MKPQMKHEAEVRPPHDSHETAQKARSENAPHLSTYGINPAAWVGEGQSGERKPENGNSEDRRPMTENGEGIDQGSAGALPYQE